MSSKADLFRLHPLPIYLKNRDQLIRNSVEQIDTIISYAVGHGSLADSPAINHAALKAKGFGDAEISKIEAGLASAFDIKFVFNKFTLGEEFCRNTLKLGKAELNDFGFDMLAHLGFDRPEIERANIYVCGAMTLEGAPHLKAEHLPVFDCANPCGRLGKRFLSAESHIRMMAASTRARAAPPPKFPSAKACL